MDFFFLLILLLLHLELVLVFLLVLHFLVSNYLIFGGLLLSCSLLLLESGLLVGFGGLLDHGEGSLSLCFSGSFVFSLHFFDVGEELESFLITDFLFFHSLKSSILNLINNDLFSLESLYNFLGFSLFLLLQDLKSLNFHHHVEFLLLSDVLFFESLVLFELFVSDGDYL